MRRKGAAAVELAVTAPVLLIFTFGILEVTNAIYLQESLEICAYEGARIALLPNTTVANVQATCDKLLAARRVSNATITVTPNQYESSPYGTEIEVRISASLSDNLITPMFVLTNQTFTANVVMMKEI
jgi:Flp pilus assembly protein TadG